MKKLYRINSLINRISPVMTRNFTSQTGKLGLFELTKELLAIKKFRDYSLDHLKQIIEPEQS